MSSSSCSRMRPMTKCTNQPFGLACCFPVRFGVLLFGLASSPNHYKPLSKYHSLFFAYFFLFIPPFTARHTSVRIAKSLVRGPDQNIIGVRASVLDGIIILKSLFFLFAHASPDHAHKPTLRSGVLFSGSVCVAKRMKR